jgi:hypothetical protein
MTGMKRRTGFPSDMKDVWNVALAVLAAPMEISFGDIHVVASECLGKTGNTISLKMSYKVS